MFRRQTTRQIRQQVRAQQEARDEARRRSRAANRTSRRSANRAADQPNWECIACQDVSNDDMGEVMECCRCKALGRFHWDCLAGQIQATADAKCTRCQRKYRDASGQHRIKRYQNYGPNILDYIFNYMLRSHPQYPGERDRLVIVNALLLAIVCLLLYRPLSILTGSQTPSFICLVIVSLVCYNDLMRRCQLFRTKFPRDMVRLTQLADGEEKIVDLTAKREQNHLEYLANMQQALEQLQQQMELDEAAQKEKEDFQEAMQQQGEQDDDDLNDFFVDQNQ